MSNQIIVNIPKKEKKIINEETNHLANKVYGEIAIEPFNQRITILEQQSIINELNEAVMICRQKGTLGIKNTSDFIRMAIRDSLQKFKEK